MTLEEYLRKNEIPVADFAKEMDVKRQTGYSWVSGEKRPSDENKIKIEDITGGHVSVLDWYNIPIHVETP